MNGQRDWQWKVVEQFVFHILRIVLNATTKIIYFEQECKTIVCNFFFKEMLCAILKGVDV